MEQQEKQKINKRWVDESFENDTDNVRILASCTTIGEGIDTKRAPT